MLLKIIEDLVDRTLSGMSAEERNGLILSVVERMIGQMESGERLALMQHVVDRFLDGLPQEERRTVVRELVPRLMSQMLESGGMSVDDLLWSAMGSLGALEKGAATTESTTTQGTIPTPSS
jgi:hypothetical protein